IEEDLARRDFTINAMAYHRSKGFLDLYGGEEDLKKKRIRLVGNPIERIREDGLRIMRAFRFVSQLGFHLEENTKRAIAQEKQMLKKIAKSRITEEWNKLVVGDFVAKTLEMMKETGALEIILPSLKLCY
ncbi:poly(A) polymerase, partial [Bacteroides pyogenes]